MSTADVTLSLEDYLRLGGDEAGAKRAAFRLMGAGLDPATITRATGLSPHVAHRRGQKQPPSSSNGVSEPAWTSGMWLFTSSANLPELGMSLDDHLAWLLDLLEPSAGRVRQLVAEQALTADFWCSYFLCESESSLGVSRRTLRRVAALDANLVFDIYGENAERGPAYWLTQARP